MTIPRITTHPLRRCRNAAMARVAFMFPKTLTFGLRNACHINLHVAVDVRNGAKKNLVHGYPDSARIWRALPSELETRFRVIAYDVRGTGASEAPRARSDNALAQLARDLLAVANATCGAQPALRALVLRSPAVRRFVARSFATPIGLATRFAVLKQVFAPEAVPGEFRTRSEGLLSLRPSGFDNASADLVAIEDADDLAQVEQRYA